MEKLENAVFLLAILVGLTVVGMSLIGIIFQSQIIMTKIASLFGQEYYDLIPLEFLLTLFIAVFLVLLLGFLIIYFVYYVKEDRKRLQRSMKIKNVKHLKRVEKNVSKP